jgi:hypothetical protein
MMTTPIPTGRRPASAPALAFSLLLPVLFLGATLLATTGVAAVEPVPHIYLPMVVRPGQSGPPSAASPYAAALSQALASCSGTALNQICYAGGSVTLDGGGPLTTPGQLASLAAVSGMTLASPDAGHWSVALLRLAADSPTPGLGLTLLAFGNVEIRNLTLFDAAAGNGDAAPALSFSSSPVPGQDPETGGLIVYNPNHEEPLSIRLNGADLTLASSAVVQAQPGVKMTVTMASGSGLVNTAAGDGALVQAHQLAVPLDGAGAAAGAPTTPTLTDEELLEPLVPATAEELLAPLVPPRPRPVLQDILGRLLADFDSAYARCMQGSSRQVYRVMYFARLLKLYKAVPDDLMSLIDVQVTQCATFELEFNSVITTTSSVVWGNMYLQAQGMVVRYDMDGHLVQPNEMPLKHLRHDIDMALPCPYQFFLTDGTLKHHAGTIRINRNRLDVSTTVTPVGVSERFIAFCPDGQYESDSLARWWDLFVQLHQSELILTGFLFSPAHWKYTGNQILGEAIISGREVMFIDGAATGDTWLVMLHKPGG